MHSFRYFIRRKWGFTLMELMIVISMMMILMSIGMIPYGIYMDRAQVEKTIDSISQEWVLAHNSVRNGILYDGIHHGILFLKLEKWAKNIDILLASGSIVGNASVYKKISLESKIEILSFSGVDQNISPFYYRIDPPYASGAFFSESNTVLNSTGIILQIGYPWASLESWRARNILLRPYYN